MKLRSNTFERLIDSACGSRLFAFEAEKLKKLEILKTIVEYK